MVNKRTAVRSRSSHEHENEPLTKMQSIIEDKKEKSLSARNHFIPYKSIISCRQKRRKTFLEEYLFCCREMIKSVFQFFVQGQEYYGIINISNKGVESNAAAGSMEEGIK